MLLKLNSIIIYGLGAFFLALALYPIYIAILKKWKIGKTIREETITGEKAKIFVELHKHKTGTPNLWWGMFLIIMILMIWLSLVLQHYDIINNSLISRQETYILLFWFFSMGILWLIDDYLNIKWHGKIKWLSAKAKLIGMFIIAWFISRRFYTRLGIDYINLRPIAGKIEIWILYPIFTFFITVSIVNAINITDGLDWLAGWLMAIILMVLATATFFYQTYIATTVIVIIIAVLLAFLRYNINPAKIFMGDSGAFALWWILASLLYILNMRMGIFIPFLIIFLIFITEIGSSGLQIIWKKYFKRKLFSVAPLHHMYEKTWHKETSIVMKAWLIQWILAAITMIAIFYQFNIPLLP